MGLVSYSDSEGSGSDEDIPKKDDPKPKQTTSSTASSKGTFQKVVDRSEPNKIRVSLPSSVVTELPQTSEDGVQADGPPAKRAKTSGAFSGFNSFLPAPKNPTKQANGISSSSGLLRNRSGNLGGGISLKTGSAPAFSRTADPGPAASDLTSSNSSKEPSDIHEGADKSEDNPMHKSQGDEVKLVGNVSRFRPLSVARKPAKKKKPSAETKPETGITTATGLSPEAATATTQATPQKPPVKERKSLFATSVDEPHIPVVEHNDNYEPVLTESNSEDVPVTELSTSHVSDHSISAPSATTHADDLESLANKMGLTASQRRQLFGRGGKPTDAQVAQFSLAAEYSHNNELLQSEANAMPQHNPVRSIAPGKHSLQQLVNAATNQKDALEESFAEGRRNKAAAGKKYGW